MKPFGKGIPFFHRNTLSVFVYEIIYKLIVFAVVTPFIYACANFAIKLSGTGFLTKKTLKKFLLSPSTYAILLVLVVVLAVIFFVHISSLIYAMEAAYREERTNSVAMLFKGVANAFRVLRPRNFGMILNTLLIFPFVGSVMIFGYVFNAKIPEFIAELIRDHHMIVAVFILLYLVVCIFASRKIFAINYFTLYKLDARQAMRASKKISKRHIVRLVIGLVFINAMLIVIITLFERTLVTVIVHFLRKNVSYKRLQFVLSIIVQIIFMILYMLFSMIGIPTIYSYICHQFYEWNGEPVTKQEREERRRGKKHERKHLIAPDKREKFNHLTTVIVVIISILLNVLYIKLSMDKKMNLNVYRPNRVSVTAHRGDSKNAPENTMAAFRLAVENQADCIELDVRQTRDGRYIIIHDSSLKRTTGLERKVGEVNYAYIQKLEAGSWFSEEYAGEPIPTLEEVLEFAKENDISLNIELKPAYTDKDYEAGILKLLEEYDYMDQCVLASSDYEVLKNIKTINSDVKTAYIVHIAFGEISDLEYADVISIRHTYVNANMVKKLHKQGKDIYAWTVNSEKTIKNLMFMDVDCIITDNPYRTKDIIYNANDTLISDWLGQIVDEY